MNYVIIITVYLLLFIIIFFEDKHEEGFSTWHPNDVEIDYKTLKRLEKEQIWN